MRLTTVAKLLSDHNLLVGAADLDLPDIEITDLSTDSRTVTPGSMFIAIPGLHYDGHEFVDQAIYNGAVAIVSEKPVHLSIPTLTVVNSRKVSAILSTFWWGNPSDDLICIGVTGTNGKTTTSFMIDAILEEAGYHTGIIGTVLTKIRRRLTESKMTTPDPWHLHHLLHHMVEQQVEAVTMEVSSHAIVQERCYGLTFPVGILTNISPDHFDLHPSLEEYIQAKGDFFKLVAPDGLALANGDDPLVQRALASSCAKTPVLFGLSPDCRIRGEDIRIDSSGVGFTLNWSELNTIGGYPVAAGSTLIDLRVPGRHNVYNALGAAAACLYLGIPPTMIKRALASFSGVSRRLQWIYRGEISVIDDFAHNPASLRAAIQACLALPARRLVLVHAIRGNRGVTINRQNAETIVDCTKEDSQRIKCILTASVDVVTEPDQVTSAEKQVFFEVFQQAKLPYRFYPKLRPALESALETAHPGDIILLVGAQGMNAGGRLFREITANHPEIVKADPYDELSCEPALLTIPDYLQLTNR